MRRRLAQAIGLLLGLALLVYGMLAWSARPRPAHPFFAAVPEVAVIAHQGGDGLWPSNTRYAMDRAVALGVDVLEMDIHSTADGVLVLSHDETVDRLTDGVGMIREMSMAQIQALDAGYRWDKAPGESFPFRGQGLVIPALEEILTAYPNMPLNIEIKQRSPSIVQPFCDLLHDTGKAEQVLVASFHPDTMVEFRETCPGVATSATEPEIRPFFALNTAFLGAVYRPPAAAFQVPEYSGGLHVVTPRFVRGAHSHNVEVHVWTVDEVADMERLLDAGVDGIITDRPDRLLELLGR